MKIRYEHLVAFLSALNIYIYLVREEAVINPPAVLVIIMCSMGLGWAVYNLCTGREW